MDDPQAPTDSELRSMLVRARTIAILGASGRPNRAAHYVPRYLHEQGYEVLPVNPQYLGDTLFGRPCVGTLSDLDEAVDILDVFRRSQDLPGHLADILAMDPLPGAVWLQLGIRNDEVAEQLRAAGIEVVQDRCLMVDHRRLVPSTSKPTAPIAES